MNSLNSEIIRKYKYAMAIWTDRADFLTDDAEPLCEDKLLELRCFDENGEFLAHRDSPYKEFSCREITDDYVTEQGVGFFDEAQYLDIDTARGCKNGYVYATGGGHYHLPKDIEGEMLLVRFFYRYDENGIARKFDWRLVGFTAEETVGKEV